MDQITTEVRIADWVSIIKQCQNRPEGQTAKQWLEENGISSKKYYYWLRKIRNQVYNETIGSISGKNDRTLSPQLAYVYRWTTTGFCVKIWYCYRGSDTIRVIGGRKLK